MAGSAGLVWIDIATFNIRTRALSDWQIWSMGLSRDGKSLYALDDRGRVAEVDTYSGTTTSMFDPGAGQPITLMRVASA